MYKKKKINLKMYRDIRVIRLNGPINNGHYNQNKSNLNNG